MKIPVVFATDENYIFYTCVAISSLARSAAPGTEYEVYILAGEDFRNQRLLDEIESKYLNVSLRILQVDQGVFGHVVINNGHVTKTTFYRLLLSSLLDRDKCIYLDSDILVTDDLEALYTVEMGDCYVAGCRDIWIDLLEDEIREARRQRAGMESLDAYVNAGVMVMNLRKIREEGMDRQFLLHLDRDYQYEDQDIINVCCYGRIKHLSPRWNIFTLFLGQQERLRQAGIGRETIEEFSQKKGIIHYATPFIRPWECSLFWANREWWDMAAEWKDTQYFRKLKEEVSVREYRERWDYWLKKCTGYERVIIFGFTVYGREVCEWLLKGGQGRKLSFCDNDRSKRDWTYKGIGVEPMDLTAKKRALFINTSQRRSGEVRQQLLDSGVQEEDILCYQSEKQGGYYCYLDSRYYLEELRDIFLRERGPGLGEYREDLQEMRRLLQTDWQYRPWYERYRLKEWILKD